MAIAKTLFYIFSIGAICVFLTWYLGHIWVFIMIVSVTLVGIALSATNKSSTPNQAKSEDEKS